MKFEIEGEPVGKGRPRLSRWGVYTPTKTVNYENLVRFSYLQATNDKFIDCDLKIEIWAIFETIKSISQKKQKELMNKPYRKKPDIDNITKSILDGLNGIAYQDDNQITELVVHKFYGPKAKAIVEITKLY